jgi:hypothetical protein
MKKIISINLVLFLLFTTLAFAHPPAKFNYQGVARNAAGQPLANQKIALRISIWDTKVTNTPPVLVYSETHTDTTNAFGLFDIAVGGGVVVTGTIKDINWAQGEKDMQVEIDPAGGTAFVLLGRSRLQSVPFSRRAEDAGMISMYGGADPINSNPNKMIIRHSVTYPAWGLSYNDADAQFNFLKNGVSVMDVDLGQSMLSVNGVLKVTGGNPGNGKVLVCDSTGLSSWQDFTTKISAFQPTGCQTLANATTTFQKVGDMGTFTKALAGTAIKLTLQTNVYATAFVGATGVVFELRVDGMATSVGNATALIRTSGTFDPINITGIFTGLPNASHTVSLWAKTINGTATNAGWDEGCLNASGTNNVLVEEYK